MEISIDINEIIFLYEKNNDNSISTSITIRNESEKTKGFKIKLKNAVNYAIKPNFGLIKPLSSEKIKILFLKSNISENAILNQKNEFLILTLDIDINLPNEKINEYIKKNQKLLSKYIKIHSKIIKKESYKDNYNSTDNINDDSLENYKLKLKNIIEEKSQLELEMNAIKDKVEYNSKQIIQEGYKFWHLFLVSLISIFIGGLLK